MRMLRVSLVCLLVVVTLNGRVAGDGVILNGISPRSLTRGGANLAHFDNGGILHDNPAAMGNISSRGLVDVGVVSLLTDFRYSDPNRSASDTSFTPLPQVAFIRQSSDGLWAYGLGFFTPAGFAGTFDMPGPFPMQEEQRYKSFGALMKVLPGLSCQLTDRLSLGGTFGVGISHAELEGPYFLQGPSPLAGTPTLLDTQGTGATPVWSLGLQYELTPATTLGLTYISDSTFTLRGNTRVEVPFLGSTRYDSELHVTWPQSVGLGARHAFCPHRVVSADLIWYGWQSAFDDFGIRLRDSTNPYFPDLVERFPLGWRDTLSLRLGYEHQLAHRRDLAGGLRSPSQSDPQFDAHSVHSGHFGELLRHWIRPSLPRLGDRLGVHVSLRAGRNRRAEWPAGRRLRQQRSQIPDPCDVPGIHEAIRLTSRGFSVTRYCSVGSSTEFAGGDDPR